VSREAAIEIAFDALLVGMLFWQPLRDVAAVGLLLLLVADAGEPLSDEWTWSVGAFLAVNLLAAVASADVEASLAELRFYPLGLLVFLGGRRTIAAGGGDRVAVVVVAMLVVFTLDEARQYLTGRSFLRASTPMWGRFQGALVYPSDVSLLALLLPIGSLALFGRDGLRAAAGALVCALVATAVSLSGTRVGFLALVIFAICAGWIHGRPRLSAAIVAIAVTIVIATAGLGLGTVASRTLSASTYRAENRLPQWRAAIELFRESPLLGQGPHGFRDIVRARHREPAFRGVHLKWAPYPHNIYLEALCGTGLFGLAALAWLMSHGARHLWRAGRDRALARAALVSLGAFAAVGLFDLSLVKDWVQVAFWLPLGIAAGGSAGGDPAEATAGRRAGGGAE